MDGWMDGSPPKVEGLISWVWVLGFGGFRWKWRKSETKVSRAIQRCMVLWFLLEANACNLYTLERYEN